MAFVSSYSTGRRTLLVGIVSHAIEEVGSNAR